MKAPRRIQLSTKPVTLEPDARVRILSLILAFGFLAMVILIARAVHVMCYEERRPKVRAVLYKRITSADIDHSTV